ncbi:diguanylate cyclase DgcJ [Shimwellia pseudoproteus]|uniref:diguanylate cyclase DgcJ n=1 Tax=Shimwellia pseudoproteus TaxID=570012 RepID=UPI002FCDFFAE
MKETKTVPESSAHTKSTIIIILITTLVFAIFINHELDNLNKYSRYIAENGKSALFHEEYINQKISLHLSRSFSAGEHKYAHGPLSPAAICQRMEHTGNIYGLNLNGHTFPSLPGTLQTYDPDCKKWAADVPGLLFFNNQIGDTSSKYSFSNYTGYKFNNTRYYIDLKNNYIYIDKIVNTKEYTFNNWLIKNHDSIDIKQSAHTIDIDENALTDLEKGESIVSHIYRDGYTKNNIISLLTPIFTHGDIKGIILTDINIADLTTSFYTRDRPFLWKFLTLYVKDNNTGKIIKFHSPSFTLFNTGNSLASITKYYTLHIGIDVQYFIITNFWIFILYILSTYLLCEYTKYHQTRQQLLAQENITDAMTGLYNRKIFALTLNKLVPQLLKKQVPITALAIDCDGLKRINDTQGHHMGDYAIECIGQAIRQSIRKNDYGIRQGGDEFVILLIGHTYHEAQAVLSRIAEALRILDKQHIVAFSSGCYQLEASDTLEIALHKADARLYAHKRSNNTVRRP